MDAEAEATRSSHSEAVMDRQPRCWKCKKKLAVFLTRPWEIDCVRCKSTNAQPA